MSAKIKYTDEPLGKVQVVPDFLPSPAELAFREEGVKVTLALSKKSIEFFKSEATKHHTQYQRMIRRLLDAYVDGQAPTRQSQHGRCAIKPRSVADFYVGALKRLAILNGLSVEDKTMEEIVNALKTKGLVSGAQKSLLAAMPKIRNHAMHADWEKLSPQDAGSVIGYVEQFLLSHFA
jgi:hypothetical protein